MVKGAVADALVERAVGPARRRTADELDRLLEAAEAVLARSGYAGLRVDDVLAEAGLSTRAFYRHFRGKSELFVALFDQEMTRAHDRLRTRLASMASAEEQVRAWIAAMLALAYDARLARRTRLFLLERPTLMTEHPEHVERCVRLLREPLEEAIAAGRAGGEFPGAEPVADALALHHLCTGLMTDRLDGTSQLTREESVTLACRFALTTLRGT